LFFVSSVKQDFLKKILILRKTKNSNEKAMSIKNLIAFYLEQI